MIPKIELIKEGLSNVRGGAFSFATAVVSDNEDCIKDCLQVNTDIIGSIKGRVTSDDKIKKAQN